MLRRLIDDGAALKGALIALCCLSLVVGSMGASMSAFAAKTPETSEEGAALKLGRVDIECADVDVVDDEGEVIDPTGASGGTEGSAENTMEGSFAPEEGDEAVSDPALAEGCELAVGMPQQRSYRITNLGEASYVRLASHTLLGELDHINDASVKELCASDEMIDEQDQRDPSAEEEALVAHDGEEDEGADGDDPSSDDEGGVPDDVEEEGPWFLAADGYWYRSVPLEPGESIIVQVSVEIPFDEEWVAALSCGAPSEVIETVDVGALQARNSVVDFASDDPWGLGRIEALPEGSDADEGAEKGAQPDGAEGESR